MKGKTALRTFVERAKEWHALDVVPVKVRDENVGGERALTELAVQFVSKHPESGATIEDVNLVSDAHLHARGVAPVAQILGLWSGRRAAYAPKSNLHKPRYC